MSIQVCPGCSSKFGFFKKKTKCYYCDQNFCRNCIKSANRRIPNRTQSNSQALAPTISGQSFKTLSISMCTKCMVMSAPGVSHIQLMGIELRSIKLFLAGRDISIEGYHEKAELAQLIVDYNRTLYPWTAPRDPYTSSTNFPSSYTTSNLGNSLSHSEVNLNQQQINRRSDNYNHVDNFSSNSSVVSQVNQGVQSDTDLNLSSLDFNEPNREASTSNANQATNRRASLSDLRSIEDIDTLPIRDIKIILTRNFVNYKGCVEKNELKDRLKQLYQSNKELEARQQKLQSTTNLDFESSLDLKNDTKNDAEGKSDELSSQAIATRQKNSNNGEQKFNEEDMCKICMDRLIDCVLVECGHMCSCVKCGKLLSECPICRQYVVRVIRVFKS